MPPVAYNCSYSKASESSSCLYYLPGGVLSSFERERYDTRDTNLKFLHRVIDILSHNPPQVPPPLHTIQSISNIAQWVVKILTRARMRQNIDRAMVDQMAEMGVTHLCVAALFSRGVGTSSRSPASQRKTAFHRGQKTRKRENNNKSPATLVRKYEDFRKSHQFGRYFWTGREISFSELRIGGSYRIKIKKGNGEIKLNSSVCVCECVCVWGYMEWNSAGPNHCVKLRPPCQ